MESRKIAFTQVRRGAGRKPSRVSGARNRGRRGPATFCPAQSPASARRRSRNGLARTDFAAAVGLQQPAVEGISRSPASRRARRSACGTSRRARRAWPARRRCTRRSRRSGAAPADAAAPRRGAAFDRHRALADRRQHLFGGRISSASAVLPSRSSPHSASTSRIDTRRQRACDPGVRHCRGSARPQVRPALQRSGPAGAARRCRRRARRQLRQVRARWRQERVARVVARQHADDLEPGRQPGLHVLDRMHGEIDASASSASSISLVNRPLPPISASGGPGPGRRSCGSPRSRARRAPRARHEPASTGRAPGRPGTAPSGCRAYRCGEGGTAWHSPCCPFYPAPAKIPTPRSARYFRSRRSAGGFSIYRALIYRTYMNAP